MKLCKKDCRFVVIVLCFVLNLVFSVYGKDISLKNWKACLKEGDILTQRDYILLLVKNMKENKGQVKALKQQELDEILGICMNKVKAFPWEEYAKKPPEAIRNLPKNDPINVATIQLYLLAYADKLGMLQGRKFAEYVQNDKKVSTYLKTYWQNVCRMAEIEAEETIAKCNKNLQAEKDAFVKVVVNKTYKSEKGYRIYGPFLENKQLIEELRKDKEAMKKVKASLSEDFPAVLSNRPHYSGPQLHVLNGMKAILPGDEYLEWLKANVNKEKVLPNIKAAMEDDIGFWEDYFEQQKRQQK